MTSRSLDQRFGIITGTATGIGRAGAIRFASEGAKLITVDNDKVEGERTVQMVKELGGTAFFIHGDVGNTETIMQAVSAAKTEFGRLDLIWGNAGIGIFKSAPETTLEEWQRIWTVNVTGNFLLAKYGIPLIIESGGGSERLNDT